jgi:integrase
LQKALTDKATIDLKPFATSAQQKIAAAIDDFRKNEDGVRVAAEITSLRLADIAFDSKTLRVIAEAQGSINVYVTALPGL